jgi:hypothetical protein
LHRKGKQALLFTLILMIFGKSMVERLPAMMHGVFKAWRCPFLRANLQASKASAEAELMLDTS